VFRCNRTTIIERGLSLTLAGSIQLVSPFLLVPGVELGLSTVPITAAVVVATVGGTIAPFRTTPESLLAGLGWPLSSPVPVLPTAQTSVGEMAVTALSVPPPPEIVGVVWTLQDVPLKNSTSGPEELLPMAQTALLDKPLTPLSAAKVAPAGLGVATADQLVPLKFSASVVGPEP